MFIYVFFCKICTVCSNDVRIYVHTHIHHVYTAITVPPHPLPTGHGLLHKPPTRVVSVQELSGGQRQHAEETQGEVSLWVASGC